MGVFNHPEAFCRMKYRCEGCGKWEWVWNSRDGVTPFLVNSRCCPEQLAQHVLWQEDERRLDYRLVPGERFFRDGTPEEAVRLMTERLDRFAEQGHIAPPEVREACIAAARDGESEWAPGWPLIAEHPEAVGPEER